MSDLFIPNLLGRLPDLPFSYEEFQTPDVRPPNPFGVPVLFYLEIKLCTYRIVLQCGDVRLDSLLHVPGRHQRRSEVDVSVDEVWLEPHGVSVVIQRLLQLTSLLEHIAQVAVRFR